MKKDIFIKRLSHKQLAIIITPSVLFGVAMTLLIPYLTAGHPGDALAIREDEKNMPLIRPVLAYNNPETKSSSPLKDDLKSIIDAKVNANEITTVAVYYRDLNTGRWFGINQDETFVPASLFKVPLMITYLKMAEKDNGLLSKVIVDNLTDDQNKNETIKPLKSAISGRTYTVDQLLHYMIEGSDNNATVILFKYVDKEVLKQVFSDLDIAVPNTINSDFISVHNYSFLFRVLYNASYLSHDMSEKGLEMLSKIDFEDGLRKNIPINITVADKFGEYYLIGGNVVNEHQLHDCGIVYHPKHPYILCIMTKGNSLDTLEKTIQGISRVVYSSVNSLK